MGCSIFLDGETFPADEDLLLRLSPGRLGGRGVFETMRVSWGRIFFFKEHLRRLRKGLRQLGLVCPYPEKEMDDWIVVLLRENRFEEGRMRLTVWREKNRMRISLIPSPQTALPTAAYQKGFTACVYPRPMKISSFGGDVKSIEYRYYLEAYAYAQNRGCDEAVLLNREGIVVEGSRANIFFVKEGTLLTPALATRCLKGVTREVVLKLARSSALRVRSSRVGLHHVLGADEAFFTNSFLGAMPLVKLNGQPISDGQAGPVTKRLLNEYRKLTLKRK